MVLGSALVQTLWYKVVLGSILRKTTLHHEMCTESIIPNTTLYYNFAQNTSQHHFVLQNLHKVLADYIFSELLAQELPVLIRTTKRRVWSVKCGVESAECDVASVEC